MMMRNALLTLFALFLSGAVLAQSKKPTADFTKADELALTVKYNGDIIKLTNELTSPFPEPIVKVRAIFRWITDNISYDYKFYNKYYLQGKDPKTFSCQGDSLGCAVKKAVWENDYINNVLGDKKAVCQGYAMLFKKMCSIINIPAEFVPGYVRTDPFQIGTPGNLNHAWNTVLLNGVNYFVDATWAAGGCRNDDNGMLASFQKHYNDYYWLTPADDFARNHFPLDAKWVLLPHYTKANFALNPYYAPMELSNVKLIAPASGVIAAKRGDTVRFKLAYTGECHNVLINSNIFRNPDGWYYTENNNHQQVRRPDSAAIKRQQPIKYKRDGENYAFEYVVKDYSLDYLEVLFDNRQIIRFKVKVAR